MRPSALGHTLIALLGLLHSGLTDPKDPALKEWRLTRTTQASSVLFHRRHLHFVHAEATMVTNLGAIPAQSLPPYDATSDQRIAVAAKFEPLEAVTLPTVETAAAAHYLRRKQQTLRAWACHEDGPLRPIRIHGRLHWRTADLCKLLGVSK